MTEHAGSPGSARDELDFYQRIYPRICGHVRTTVREGVGPIRDGGCLACDECDHPECHEEKCDCGH